MDEKSPYKTSLDHGGPENQTEWAPPALLLEVASGDDDLIREVVGDFERDTENRLELTRRALAAGDRAKLRAEAHAIKGGARQVGAVAVADICQQIELAAPQSSPYELADRLTLLEAEFRQVCGAMNVYLNR